MPTPWVTRLAPSPTGAMHLGNARTFGATWWWARAEGARLLLRIEDLDHPKKKPGAIEGLRADMAFLGIDYDAETAIQSTRAARHEEALERLVRDGAVYPCVCTRKDVDEAASAPHPVHGERPYPGTCRGRFGSIDEATRAAGRPPALRFLWSEGVEAIDDLVLGPRTFGPDAAGGDFVVGRVDDRGTPRAGYQLAVVVDDADDGVDRVVRGADLLTSAARQRRVQRALGLPFVSYAHLPLVVGEDGRRLAKRHGDTRLSAVAAAGATKDDVFSWIAASLGAEPDAPERLIARGFDPSLVPKRPVLGPSPTPEGLRLPPVFAPPETPLF
jgi:glutamyl-tRNA synthetase